MKTFDILGILLFIVAMVVPSPRIELWLGLCVASLLCCLVSFAIAFWDANGGEL